MIGSSQGLSGSETMACSGCTTMGDRSDSMSSSRGVLPATAQSTLRVAM